MLASSRAKWLALLVLCLSEPPPEATKPNTPIAFARSAEHRARHQDRDDVGARDVADLEQPQRDERRGRPGLDQREDSQENGRPVAANRTDSLEAAGNSAVSALNGGYHLAFALATLFALAAAGAAFALIRAAMPAMAHGELSEPALDASV